jgi:hypothetical protein
MAGVAPFGYLAQKTDSTVNLPELRDQEGVVKWMEVPREWVDHRDAAERAREALGERFSFDDRNALQAPHEERNTNIPEFVENGVVELGLERAPETYGGKNGFQLSVTVDPDHLSVEIPDSVNGIPVVTEEREGPPVDLCLNSTYGDVSGGVKVSDGADSGKYGTTAFKVYYPHSDEYYMITAAHVVNSGDVYGDGTVFNFEQIGSVYHSYSQEEQDFTVFSCSRNINNTIEGDGNTYDIGGWVTEDGISSRVSSWTDGYRKSGCTTGETTDGLGKYKIGDSYHSDTPSYAGEGVRESATAAGGDSGGTGFSLHDGEAYVTHLITQGDPKSTQSTADCNNADQYSKSMGVAVYLINSAYNVIGSSHS